MAFAWYTPTLVQKFGSVKNTDINANLNAIQAAFNAQNSWTPVSGSYAVPTTGNRNVLVDLSALQSNYMVVTLPPNPAVGDPSVSVCVVATGLNVGTIFDTSVFLATSDGNKIDGIAGAAGTPGLPYLTNPGDCVTLSFIGGTQGWATVGGNINAYVNQAGGQLQEYGVAAPYLFSGLNIVADLTAYPALRPNLNIPLAVNGQQCSFTIGVLGTSLGVAIGTSGQTFNGVVGPKNLSVASVRSLFTRTAANTFIVTT